MSRPRVFVSSVIRGLEAEREAARRAIEAAGGTAVLVNEDFAAMPASPRNVCLDAVSSSDIVVCIVGDRVGATAPSGRTVVQEELSEARSRSLPTLLFVKKCDRDAEARAVLSELEGFTDGRFRKEFQEESDLGGIIQEALLPVIRGLSFAQTSEATVRSRYEQLDREMDRPIVRGVFAPERSDELIPPQRLGSDEFAHEVFALVHRHDLRLFDYSHRSDHSVTRSEASFRSRGDHERLISAVKINGNGWVDFSVGIPSPVRGSNHHISVDHVLDEDDLRATVHRSLSFTAALFDTLDPHLRHEQVLGCLGIGHLDGRRIERNGERGSSVGSNSWGDSPSLIDAYEGVRRLSRHRLRSPDEEVDRAMAMIKQSVNTPSW